MQLLVIDVLLFNCRIFSRRVEEIFARGKQRNFSLALVWLLADLNAKFIVELAFQNKSVNILV